MFHCLVIKVLYLLSCDSSFILSHSQLFVKNFFNFFSKLFIQEVLKRRRRDLNPRAAINDLLPFQGSPFGQLGYFSKLPYAIALVYFFTRSVLYYIALFFFCQELFRLFSKSFLFLTSGESGIRTHAPLRTNGFQDRLVMTTSISLRIHFSVFFALLCQRKTYSIIELPTCQHLNLHFFIFFQKSFCNIEIFWCCDLDILVGAFYQADLGAFFLLYYHGIIGDS